jgi:hypothetical protein
MRNTMQKSSSFSFEEEESIKGSMFPVNENKPAKSKFFKNNVKK